MRPACARAVSRTAAKTSSAASGADDQHHLALVGEHERVVAEQLAHRAHRPGETGIASSSTRCPDQLLGQLREHGGEAAAGGIAQEAHGLFPAARRRRERASTRLQSGAQSLSTRDAEVELAARRQHGHGVVADAAAEQHGVAGAHGGGAEMSCSTTISPTPVVVM